MIEILRQLNKNGLIRKKKKDWRQRKKDKQHNKLKNDNFILFLIIFFLSKKII